MATVGLHRSATKGQYMRAIGLDSNEPSHEALYLLMKVIGKWSIRELITHTLQNEAIRVFNAQMRNTRATLRPEHANAQQPFAAHQFTEAAFSEAVRTIWANACTATRPWYERGRVPGDNWIILWMLYHVCRYRDSRNSRARSSNFHDDDNLEQVPAESEQRSSSSRPSSQLE